MDISRNSQVENKHYYYLDLLRVISSLAVIMIHVSAHFLPSTPINSANYWIGIIPNAISRFAVPMFLMISGSIFLNEDKNVTFKKMLSHIIKLAIFFVVWSLLYASVYELIKPSIEGRAINVRQFFRVFIEGRYHLWFCYVIVGLYLITPLLRLWIKKENKKYILYFLVLSYIFGQFLPLLVTLLSLYGKSTFIIDVAISMSIYYVTGFILFYILGYYLHKFDVEHKKTLYVIGAIAIIAATIGNYFISRSFGKLHIELYYESNALTIFYAAALFILFKNINFKENEFITSLSKLTLGVYGSHDIIMNMYYLVIPAVVSKNMLFDVTIIFLLVSITCFGLTYVGKKIPIVKRVF